MADDGTLRETHDSALGDTSGPVTSEAARVHSPYIEQEGQNRSTARLGARYEGGGTPNIFVANTRGQALPHKILCVQNAVSHGR